MRKRGYPPTVREIGEAVGLTSSSSVHAQLTNLERKGLLHKDPTKPRAMALSEPKAEAVSVPLVGRIAAGAPVLAAEHVEEYVAVPEDFAGDDAAHFALTVAGDSMIGAGIFDGDLVIVRQQDDAEDGDIVAALLPGPAEDEATVKTARSRRRSRHAHPGEPAARALRDDRGPPPRQGRRGHAQALRASILMGTSHQEVRMPPGDTQLERQIRSQPEALHAVLTSSQVLEQVGVAAQGLHRARRIWLVGTGTSQHAAELGAAMMHESGRAAQAVPSMHFVDWAPIVDPRDGVLVITHTAETAYALAARAVAFNAGMDVTMITRKGSGSPTPSRPWTRRRRRPTPPATRRRSPSSRCSRNRWARGASPPTRSPTFRRRWPRPSTVRGPTRCRTTRGSWSSRARARPP